MADIEAILAERGKTHGKYEDHALITQITKDVWQGGPGWLKLSSAQRETLDMIAHKVGRILSGNPDVHDHWDDIAGYSTLASKDIDRLREARVKKIGAVKFCKAYGKAQANMFKRPVIDTAQHPATERLIEPSVVEELTSPGAYRPVAHKGWTDFGH